MKSKVRSPFLCIAAILLALTLVVSAATENNGPHESCLADSELSPFQGALIELAFESAAAIPITPHVKDRSRSQEIVVEVCLQLNQPQRALRYIEQIVNWRRGIGYADYALYCTEHGDADKSENALNLAIEVA